MNLCEQAETLRLLLIMQVVSKSEVIAWADGVIAANERVPEWVLDISLAANDDVLRLDSKLRDVPFEGDRAEVAYSAADRFADAYRSGSIPALRAADMLALWAASVKVSDDDWMAAMTPLWVADEIEYGIATEEDVRIHVDGFIERVAGRGEKQTPAK